MTYFPFDPATFRWEGVADRAYKDDPGVARGMAWQGISRNTLARGAFEVRYFEVAPGGFSSLEKHAHEHAVICVRGARAGAGRRRGARAAAVRPRPQSGPWVPHRWVNAGDEPFGFLCSVDGERDKPAPLSDEEWEALRANPLTAPFAH